MFVVCALLASLSMFVPAVELEVGGVAISHRTAESIYQIDTNKGFARKLLARYRASKHARVGKQIVNTVMPHSGGKLHGHLDDISSAMQSLDEVSDDDVETVGKFLTITLWSFLALELLGAGLVFGDLMAGSYRRNRLIVALATAVLTTAVAVVLHLVLREAAWELDDDLGFNAVGLAFAAYSLPIATIGGLVAVIAALVQRRRLAKRISGSSLP